MATSHLRLQISLAKENRRKNTTFDIAALTLNDENSGTQNNDWPYMSLRLQAITVLQQHGEPVTYRELTDLVWSAYPDVKQHYLDLYKVEAKARQELRIRFGTFVKAYPQIFSATMSDGRVMVGIAPTQESELEEAELEAEDEGLPGVKPSVYWYTFPAYQSNSGPFPVKIGKGNDPEARIRSQVTAMPEKPVILGTYEHADPIALERALHSILILRGKRKTDAPGTEWFMTTPAEIKNLIELVLG